MKKTLLPLLLIFFSLFISQDIQAQRFEWLKIYSSSGFSTGDQFIEVSGNNVFVAGEFQGSLSFGSTVLNSGTTRTIYLANYDTLGNFRWAIRNTGGSTFTDVIDIDVDDSANVYLTGMYNTSMSWGSTSLSLGNSSSSREAFIVKIDDQGVAQWIRGIYSPTTTFSFRGVVDISVSDNKVFIAGQQVSDIRFTGSSLILRQTTGSAFQQNNIFVGELDHNGNPLALNRIITAAANVTNFNSVGDIEALNDSVFYFSGTYRGQYTFGTNNVPLPNTTSNILGVHKFTNYDCDWLVRPTSSSGVFTFVPQISVANNGDLYLAGNTTGNMVIQNNTITAPPGFSSFLRYIYALRISSSGSLLNFKSFNAPNQNITDSDLNAKNEFLISADFRDSVDINGVKTFPNGTFSGDHLIIKLDTDLDPMWYQTGGGGNADLPLSLAADEGKTSFYVSGNFRGLSQFGTTFFAGNTSFSTSIIYKMDDCGSNPVPITFSGDTNLCQGQSVRIIANPPTLATFQWMRDSVILAGEVFRDLLVSTSGNYQVIVNGSGCLDTSRVIRVNVGTPPTVTYAQRDTVCEQDAPIALSGGLPLGGTYKGPGVVNNTFDPSLTGIGTYQIRYVFSNNGCADSATSSIFVKPAPTVFFAPISNICITASPITLTNAFPSGGTFSGNGVTGNQFDPQIAGGGFTDITYTYTDPNGCVGTAIQTVEVDTLPSVALNPIADICANESPRLLVEGVPAGGVYSGPGVVNGSFDPSLTGTGTYTITYSLSNQCGSSSATQSITVISAPSASLGSFADLCENDGPVSLSGGSPTGGTYSGVGVSGGSFDPSVSGTGTFTIYYEFTNAIGCTDRDSSTITVNPLPNSSISPNTSICLGSSTTLQATGGTSYLWSTSASTASINVSPTTTTNYSVTITTANGCSAVENATVTVNPLPTTSISGTSVICEGSSTTLTASGGQSYSWSNSASTAAITVAPTVTTTYTVTATDANGCTDTESQVVTVNPAPNVSLGSFADLCENDGPITLSGGTPAGGTYSGPGVSAGSFDPNVSGVGTFLIYYSFTDAIGCSARDSSFITVNPLPITSITPNTSICLGSSTTLQATGGTSYLWSTSATTASINVSPTTTTNYSVTITNANNCSAVENVTVSVNPLPTASISGTSVICEGSSTTLTASGGQSYSWNNSASTAAITVSPTVTTTYTVTATDANGCTDTESQIVTVNPAPNVSLGSFADLCEGDAPITLSGGTPAGGTYFGTGVIAGNFDPNLSGVGTFTIFYSFTDAIGCSAVDSSSITVNPLPITTITPDTSICSGSSINLNATGGTTYLWNTSATTAGITVSPTTTTNYSVTITNSNNCSVVENVTVTVNSSPSASINGNSTICAGSSTTLTATGGGNYLWSNNASTAAITVSPSANTTYSVTVTNSFGCTSTASQSVTVNPLPSITVSNDTAICLGDSVQLTASGSTASYLWSTNETTSQIIAKPQNTTNYTVTLTDANGCTASGSVLVTVNTGSPINIGPDTLLDPVNTTSYTYDAGIGFFISYLWQDNSTNQTLTVNYDPAKAGTTDTISVIAFTSSGCPSVDTALVTYDLASGISENYSLESIISVSPNPTTDQVNIRFSKTGKGFRNIQLFDLNGKIVFDQKYDASLDLITLDLMEWKFNKGVYLLNIEENGQFFQEKIVVQ